MAPRKEKAEKTGAEEGDKFALAFSDAYSKMSNRDCYDSGVSQ